MLPLDSLVLTIGTGKEPGPNPQNQIDQKASVLTLGYDQITTDLFHQIQPDNVVSWLYCAQYDACDVAELLCRARFRGRYHAAAASLPRARMVEREIRARFPELDFVIDCQVPLSGDSARYHAMICAASLGAGADAGTHTGTNTSNGAGGNGANNKPALERSLHDA